MMKKITKMLVLALALVAVFSLGAGSTAEAAKKKKVTVKKVTAIDKATGKKVTGITLAKGGKATLSASVSVTPSTKANKKVGYKTSSKSVADVSSKGVITAKKAGKATITVYSKKNTKKKATVKVTVKSGIKITSVKLDKKSADLEEGATLTLTSTVKATPKKYAGKNKNVIWSSSDTKVATVKNGKVTAKKAGKATITVYSRYNRSKKATCKITVTAKPAPAPTTVKRTVKFTENAEVSAEVAFKTTDMAAVKADIVKFAGLAQKTTVTANINGVDRQVVVTGNDVTVGGKALTDYQVKTITVKANIKASKIVPAVVFAPTSVASVKIDNVTFTEITDKTVNIGGVVYNYTVNGDNTVTIEGATDPATALTGVKGITVQ